jgi:cholesterol oxidase
MKDSYGAVVIGSGFGGAVAACRLAQAGIDVCVVERGRRYGAGEFPRWGREGSTWLWQEEQGLFDLKPLQEMQVVQAAGWGGGSLIYANVHLRPVPDVFARGWPAGYSRAALDPYYDLVGYMLDVKPITESGEPLPKKTSLMARVAEKLGRKDQLCYPNIAVEFGDPGRPRKNKFDVTQNGCTQCGECDIGCNIHAKNTLDLNYLALAERSGAMARTQCEAWKIERTNEGYVVHVKDHAAAGALQTITAKRVFLCAGAVNTTELLLRCKNEFGTLPNLGDRLGHGYSGNGDFLAAAYETDEAFEPSLGPVITTGLVYDRGEDDAKVWFILQDGGFPKQVAALTQLLAPDAAWLKDAEFYLKEDLESAMGDAATGAMNAPEPPGVANTALFLAMGRDRANGQIELIPITKELRVIWDVTKNLPLYDGATRLVTDIANELGGRVELNPFWKRMHVPVSVHNLGGCVMADDPALGVTSPIGEVYNYPGLYVLDGAVLPAATGVNPSSTIAAVAERNIERIIRDALNNPAWEAPERAKAKPIDDPVSGIKVPPGGVAPSRVKPVGLAFTETMKGFIQRGAVPIHDYAAAEETGEKSGTRIEFTLTITMPDLDQFLIDKTHAGIASGKLFVTGFTPPEGAIVRSGVFNLFTDTDRFYERQMLYLLPFVGLDGKRYVLDGFKEVKDHGHFDVWGATSTLYTVIREGHTKAGAVVATGILHIHLMDFMEQMTTFEVLGTQDPIKKTEALARFGESFMGNLWHTFVRPRLS